MERRFTKLASLGKQVAHCRATHLRLTSAFDYINSFIGPGSYRPGHLRRKLTRIKLPAENISSGKLNKSSGELNTEIMHLKSKMIYRTQSIYPFNPSISSIPSVPSIPPIPSIPSIPSSTLAPTLRSGTFTSSKVRHFHQL